MRSTALLLGTLLLVAPALAGCLADPGSTTSSGPSADSPAPVATSQLPDEITDVEHLAQVSGVSTGAGIYVHGDHAYVSGLSSEFTILDVSDPTDVTVVGSLEDIYTRDADILEHGNHSHAAILAGQSDGMHVVDVDDPTDPQLITTIRPDGAVSHNAAVLPGTTLVYNSDGSGRGGEVQVLNLSDPYNPELVATFGRSGCHDITFHRTEDKDRLVCAGEAATELYDLSDPLDPEYISEVRNPFISVVGFAGGDGGSLTPGLHHWSLLSHDGDVLIIGDEFAGGGGPGCYLYDASTGRTVASPIGALWFYDVRDEEDPQLLGWFSPPTPVDNGESTSCTAHFGELLPGRDQLVVGWYAAGVLLVDFSDPADPVLVDQWNQGTNTWDVRRKGKHLLTGDTLRGTDILELAGA